MVGEEAADERAGDEAEAHEPGQHALQRGVAPAGVEVGDEDEGEALERAGAQAYGAMLRETAERIDAAGGHAFRPTVDLGLRTTAVMTEWLREQLAQAD